MKFTSIESIICNQMTGCQTLIPCEGNTVSRELSSTERQHIHNVLVALRRSDCELLYRGEKMNSLRSRFSPHNNTAPPPETTKISSTIARSMFFFGEKGRHFWNSKLLRPEAKRLLKELNFDGVKAINYLLEALKECIQNSDTKEVKAFSKENHEFVFSLNSREESIELNLRSLASEEKKLLINFLVFFLHNLSSVRNTTPFVSATKSIKIAYGFAHSKLDQDNQDHACIIGCFLPFLWKDRVARTDNLGSISPILQKLSIPNLLSYPYKQQREVAFFGAIFPHYILFLADVTGQRVFVNPALLNTEIANVESIAMQGLDIDQVDFERRLGSETAYALGINRTTDVDTEIINTSQTF